MSTLRVALLGMKPRLRNILTDAVTREIDMRLIDFQIDEPAGTAGDRPDVMVCEIEDPLNDELPGRLLCAVPDARVLAVAHAGDRAVLYELRPTRTVLADVSVGQVIDVIRSGLDKGRAWQEARPVNHTTGD